jgi:tetratricopeptide (TPR) repeat protein
MVLMPLLVLALLEVGLRVAGFGYPTSFFLKRADGQTLTTNPYFAWRFHPGEGATKPYPLAMPIRKAPGTCRIFVLGESAAQGTPAPAFGFARILEALLERQFPGKKFEVVNAAMRGINSHVVRFIARECAACEPDFFIVYLGNNEAVGLYAPEPGGFSLTPHWRLQRLTQWLKGTKIGQAVQILTRAASKPAPKQDMELFRRKRLLQDDPRRAAVYANFQRNLADICRVAQGSGARVIVSTLAANLQDFPPLGSLHRPGLAPAARAAWEASYAQGAAAEARNAPAEAIPFFLEALQIDEHFADLHFRLGRCYLAGGQLESARRHFTLARDWDATQFRTDSRLNDLIRQAAGTQADRLVLTDLERVFAERAAAEGRLPGSAWFQDHVHFNFDGDYLAARTFLEAIAWVLPKMDSVNKNSATSALTLPRPAVPSRAACAEALGFSEWDEISVQAAVVRALAQPPYLDQLEHAGRQARAEAASRRRVEQFQSEAGIPRAVAFYQAALARRPEDWQLHFNFGSLLKDFGNNHGALGEFSVTTRLMPEFLPVRILLGECLWRAQRRDEAVRQFREALRYDPHYSPAKDALAQVAQKK